jgi:hypothetical protein
MKPVLDADPIPDRLPSQGVRTLVSLLLFAHLFALLAAMLSNPQDRMSSRLLNKLGNVPFLSAYTEALWMESAYDFFYTYGNNEFVIALGTDHQIEADLSFADGRTETLHIPDDSRFPRLSYQRVQNMCNNAARMVGQQGAEAIVPAAVAEGILRATGADAVTLRLKRRLMQTMDLVSSSSSAARNPYDRRYAQVIYTGYAQMRNGRVDYRKLEDAGGASTTRGAGGTAPASSTAPPSSSAPPPSSAAPPPSSAAPPPRRPVPRPNTSRP